MTDPKPMDSERLAQLSELVADFPVGAAGGFLVAEVIELLNSHTYQERRADAAEQGEPNSWRLDTLRRLANLPPDATWSDCIVRLRRLERERDEARAEVTRLRARVRVEAEDVERAGVTKAHVEAWLRADGWAPSSREGGWNSVTGHHELWRKVPRDECGVRVDDHDSVSATLDAINSIVCHRKRPGLDILDEMAAMPLPDESEP